MVSEWFLVDFRLVSECFFGSVSGWFLVGPLVGFWLACWLVFWLVPSWFLVVFCLASGCPSGWCLLGFWLVSGRLSAWFLADFRFVSD